KDQSLVTLESDKATMEVPSSVAGVVKEIRVKVDGTVSEGDVVAIIESADAAAPSPLPQAGKAAAQSAAGEGKRETPSQVPPSAQPSPASGRGGTASASSAVANVSPTPKGAAETGRKADIECQVVVLGSGPGGYTAAFRAADLGQNTVLIERYAAL